jgi:ABC-type multidrug transport system ATPase subunit
MAGVLHAVAVEKWRGKRRVLTGVDFAVQRGEIISIIGKNGAGKSTLMAILAGVLQPDAGAIRLCGKDLTQWGRQAYAHLGVALQVPGLTPRLTVRETLAFYSCCYAGDRPVDELLERFHLVEKRHTQTHRLSEGEKRRVWLALAFLKAFNVILLDEPTAGIDPAGRQAVWAEIHRARDHGAAVVCTTHLMDEAQQLSDRLLILHEGCQVASDTLQGLLTRTRGGEKVTLQVESNIVLDSTLDGLPGVTHVHRHGHTVTLYCHSAREVMQVLLSRDGLSHLAGGKLSLEDVVPLLTEQRRAL